MAPATEIQLRQVTKNKLPRHIPYADWTSAKLPFVSQSMAAARDVGRDDWMPETVKRKRDEDEENQVEVVEDLDYRWWKKWGPGVEEEGKLDPSVYHMRGKNASVQMYEFNFDKRRGQERFEPAPEFLHLWKTEVSPHDPTYIPSIKMALKREEAYWYAMLADSGRHNDEAVRRTLSICAPDLTCSLGDVPVQNRITEKR